MIGGAALGQVSPRGDGDPKSCPGVVTRSRGVTGRGVVGSSFGRELGGVGTSSPGVDTERRGLSFEWSTTVMEGASAQCAPCATLPPVVAARTNDQQSTHLPTCKFYTPTCTTTTTTTILHTARLIINTTTAHTPTPGVKLDLDKGGEQRPFGRPAFDVCVLLWAANHPKRTAPPRP